jgi:two-component system phosphate regulon response regulator OmpR
MAGAGTVTDTAPHILVVDDDQRLRELLRKFLIENRYRVTTAADAAEARRKLEGLRFDLIVLDVMMPGEDGFQFTAALRQRSDVPILLLTAMGEAEHRISGLERGADDYLSKPFEPRELVLRIGTILKRTRGGREAAGSIQLGPFTFDLERGELRRGGDLVHLTGAETALLALLASSPGLTMTRAELGRRSAATSERSVDVQVTRLRRKIEADPKAPRYLQTVWGEGYVLWPE